MPGRWRGLTTCGISAAKRETSRAATVPTRPRQTSATMRSNPARVVPPLARARRGLKARGIIAGLRGIGMESSNGSTPVNPIASASGNPYESLRPRALVLRARWAYMSCPHRTCTGSCQAGRRRLTISDTTSRHEFGAKSPKIQVKGLKVDKNSVDQTVHEEDFIFHFCTLNPAFQEEGKALA